ncbi:uncharacterized protein LOC141718667 [Apium graveolens]|uniref:uncharacterized protein LOC141718667 n=1 Tax=Apium graveolens TaxID=4045 RepID=UPI003D7B603C
MDDMHEIWINLPKFSEGYIKGIQAFIKHAFPKMAVGDEMTRPCKNCKNIKWHCQDVVYDHLICFGPDPLYANWIIEINESCVQGITESGFGEILELIKEAFPEANIPLSFSVVKNIIRDLGLNYKKIHACPNSCMLYWGEIEKEEKCRTCGLSRWVIVEKSNMNDDEAHKIPRKVPANVMRYFPLRPRLQRLFMCKDNSKLMVWHALGCKKDGKLRHPADAEAWKKMNALYPQFSLENRNIRLGLAADGFNPFRSMNINHSTWPIVLVNYNLPPWLCMKPENLILSTLISGPESPKNSIDVYMQLLIAELNELWNEGAETHDASTGQIFTLRASLLWTISDFAGYAMLSGWSMKGYLGCPDTNGGSIKKDHVNARLHLEELGIRKELYPVKSSDGKYLEIRAAIFDMTNDEKDRFFKVLKNAKLPYGSASNIARLRLKKSLKPVVSIPLIRLGAFLRSIWSKVIDLSEMNRLQQEIVEILCQFETVFTQAFFDIMVHLLVHLCSELAYGGLAYLRSMWGVERYLCKLKNYVRNRSKPKGSIDECYLAEECLTFCSRFLGSNAGSNTVQSRKFEGCPEKLE